MEYKTPKILERTPLVAGYPVMSVMIVVICLLLFIFLVFKNILISLVFLIIPVTYLYIEKKFPGKGEFKEYFLEYKFGIKCIRFNKKLENLIHINATENHIK